MQQARSIGIRLDMLSRRASAVNLIILYWPSHFDDLESNNMLATSRVRKEVPALVRCGCVPAEGVKTKHALAGSRMCRQTVSACRDASIYPILG